ncbi:MAG: HD domain-containing protein [Thermoproteota archaeon]
MLGVLKRFLPHKQSYKYAITIDELSRIWVKDVPPPIQSPQVKVNTTESAPVPSFSVYDELKDLLEPARQLIETKGLWQGLMDVFSFVEKYGSYPSVVLKDDSVEYRDDVLSILSQITLKEHAVTVSRLAIQGLQKSFKDPIGLIFIVTVAGLMHDIGKAEPLRSSPQYSKYDHPQISADVVSAIFKDVDAYEVNKAIEIIKNHHRVSKDTLTGLLQEADELARVEELKRHGRIVQSITDVFAAGDIINLLDAYVNTPKSESEWGVFSFKGYVFVEPDFLYELILREATNKEIILSGQIRQISRPVFLKTIVGIFKEARMLADTDLSYGYYSVYEVSTNLASRKMKLIPLLMTAFGKLPSEFEQRKFTQSRSGSIKFITSVNKISK